MTTDLHNHKGKKAKISPVVQIVRLQYRSNVMDNKWQYQVSKSFLPAW